MKRNHLLLVDDDQDMHLIYKSALGTYDISYDDAFDGREAVELLKHKTYDLILLDLVMPEVNGFEFFDKARDAKITLPFVIVCSSMREKEIVMAAFQLGANDFLFKPIQPNLLRQTVSSYLDIIQKTQTEFDNLKTLLADELDLSPKDLNNVSPESRLSQLEAGGSLRFDSIAKAISYMVFNRLTGKLSVSNISYKGQLDYENGRLQKVVFGNKSGIDALDSIKSQQYLDIILLSPSAA